ncbi:MAG: V-type ATPase subunit [Clostridiales bacterium]|nr:V-type ATPase subunit [Clostridiales bacterium]
MKDTNYAFAVARIRYHELKLLDAGQLEQLITASDTKEVLRRLRDSGWDVPDAGADPSQVLETETARAWDLLLECAPDIHELDALIVRNDFHNLKAVLKCLYSDQDPAPYLITPACIEGAQLAKAVKEKNYGLLPHWMEKPARESYQCMVETRSGQSTDMSADRYAIETMADMARATGNDIMIQLIRIICDCANLKSAFRCVRTGKDRAFIDRCLADTGGISRDSLAEACAKGLDALLAYLEFTQYREAAQAYQESAAQFETWCDDQVMQLLQKAKTMAFGLEPLAAYYLAKEAEVKNIRIILSAKENGLSDDAIRQRMRQLYV